MRSRAAADPANPYGAALPWPTSLTSGHRPGRKAGAVVVPVNLLLNPKEVAYILNDAGAEVYTRAGAFGVTYLVTNGGLHHHLAASGNFGQVIRKNYPVVTSHRVAEGPREVASVVGPLCTPLDILGDKMELGEAQVGDLMVVLQSGAYGYTASPHLFLGHPAPLQVLV